MKTMFGKALTLGTTLGLLVLAAGCQSPSSAVTTSLVASVPTYSRHVALTGAYNFRDLGGYATADNHTTKWGVYYRSDALDNLTASDISTLVSDKITNVVDFRSASEYAGAGADVESTNSAFTYVQEPITVATPTGTGAKVAFGPATTSAFTVTDMENLYHTIIGNTGVSYNGSAQTAAVGSAVQYAGMFHTLAAQPSGTSTVFHCTMGKDRAGIGAALLLLAANVDDTTIINDYNLTESYDAPLVAALLPSDISMIKTAYGFTVTADQLMAADGLIFAEAPQAVMADTLNWIRTEYGSVLAYLESGTTANANATSATLTKAQIDADYATVLANFVQ